jgi:hypothetical protein
MRHSEALLGYTSPTAHIDIQWTLLDNAARLECLETNQCPIIDESSTQTDGSVDATNWPLMDEFVTWDPDGSHSVFPSGELGILEEQGD